MKTNIEIARKTKLRPIKEIAGKIGLKERNLRLYGNHIAKVDLNLLKKLGNKKEGKLVLVSCMTPTRFGEGKTTTAIGLSQGLQRLGKKTIACLREPSMGPVFGIKGGGCGAGYSQIVPMGEINLAFTGDIPAVTASNNLLAAVIDNHLFNGNCLELNVDSISWKRCLDVNDRALREIVVGEGKENGVKRKTGFNISAASEVMAVLSLATDLNELKKKLDRIVVGLNRKGEEVTVKDLGVGGAMTVLLKEALNPNLVQTTEGTPAFVHGGAFANIAHGTNSIASTKLGLKLADYCVVEAGFGADLGAEKFFDIVCREFRLRPSAVVLVATVKALKWHGNGDLEKGFGNLKRNIEIIQGFGLPVVVAVNKFREDKRNELEKVIESCKEIGVKAVITEVSEKGGNGGIDLAREVVKVSKKKITPKFVYSLDSGIKEKIECICKKVYKASNVTYSEKAEKEISELEKNHGNLPICMAKTQLSLSADKELIGAPENFAVNIAEAYLSAGAGFIVVLTGKISTMPGLPKKPNAEKIDLNPKGEIIGLT